ncbi:MAG: hypothetical protein ACREIV_16675 [Planctomycetaceae bacterium]
MKKQPSFDAEHLRLLAVPLYVVAAFLVLIPISEAGAAIGWTFRTDAIRWRTGVVGTISSTLVTPIFGLFIAIIGASLYRHRRTLQTLSVITGMGALFLVATALLFSLDGLQLRRSIRPEFARSYDIAIIKTLLNLGAGAFATGLLAIAGFRISRRLGRAAAREDVRDTEIPLVRKPRPASAGDDHAATTSLA